MITSLEQLKQIIREAWRTLSMLPDPDARFRRVFGAGWPFAVVNDPNTAYGATPANWKGVATAREITVMDEVLVWLLWLRMQKPVMIKNDREIVGEYAVGRIISILGMEIPLWRIAQRERCSERTITRRIDRSITKIAVKFENEIEKIIPMFEAEPDQPPINEPEIRPERIRGFRNFEGDEWAESPESLEPGKVYIGGEGMRFKGQKYRSPQDYDEKACAKPRR